ncbi:MAG: hypothetical protein KC619_12255 [Myxococcales bacterium]|nr:hypothetical protein [Myxococcales bacterium]
MDTLRAPLVVLLLAALASGCIGVSPEQAAARAVGRGEDDDDGDPEHNPGTPCLVCHGPDYSPGDEVFSLAGTVFLRSSDADRNGLAGVNVHVRDATGREMVVETNRAGNFMFEEGGRGDRGRGRYQASPPPEFPLEVWIESGGTEQHMRGLIRREGSCAACHSGAPSATSVGRIFLMDAP